MNTKLRLAILIALVLYFICIFHLLKKKRLGLRYTLLWLLSGVIMVLIALFPSPFAFLMRQIGVIEMTNGLFAVMLFLLIIILISMTAVITGLNERVRTLTQRYAQIEKRLRELENEKTDRTDPE